MPGEYERRREQAEAQKDHELPASQERDMDDGPVSGGPNGGQTLGHGQDPGWRSQAPEGTSAQAPAEGARQEGGDRLHQQQEQQQQQQQGGAMFQGGGDGAGHEGHPHSRVREHMEVVGADGVHLGTVDAVDGERIKLTRADSGSGAVDGQRGRHHYLPVGLVAAVEGNRVRLSANADVAYGMEELD